MAKKFTFTDMPEEWQNEWDATCAKLRNSGADLSKIKITCDDENIMRMYDKQREE